MPATTFVRDQILNAYLNGIAFSIPADAYVGFSTTVPNLDGTNVSEPVGLGYARILPTGAPQFTLAGADPRVAANTEFLASPLALGSWGTLVEAVIFDALAAGNLLFYGAIAPQLIGLNQRLVYNALGLEFSITS